MNLLDPVTIFIIYIRVMYEEIDFLFGSIFMWVPKKVKGFYFQKIVTVLYKAPVFGYWSIS